QRHSVVGLQCENAAEQGSRLVDLVQVLLRQSQIAHGLREIGPQPYRLFVERNRLDKLAAISEKRGEVVQHVGVVRCHCERGSTGALGILEMAQLALNTGQIGPRRDQIRCERDSTLKRTEPALELSVLAVDDAEIVEQVGSSPEARCCLELLSRLLE